MTKHTSGPWHARVMPEQEGSPDPEWEVWVHFEDEDHCLCVAVVCAGMDGQQEANARLIETAPDLLAFVKRIASHDERFAKGARKQEIADARALLAAATGAA